MKKYQKILLLISAIAVVGCSTPVDSNKVYSRSALNSATRTIEAVIVSKRDVLVDPSTGVGSSAGGAVGAIGGSSLGGSRRDNLAGAVVGAVVGSAIGSAMESSATKINAFEYIVKSDVAGLLTVVQTDNEFSVGQKVFVILGSKPVIVKAGP